VNGEARGRVLRLVLVAVVSTLPFLPALDAPFIFDDVKNIVQNVNLDGVRLESFFSDPTTFSVKPGNWPYRPLVVAANAALVAVAGPTPFPFHLFQLALHLASSLLVFIVAERAFGLRLGALAAALLFAAAPIQTQAVSYVSARSMAQAMPGALFCLLALATAARATRFRSSFLWQAAAALGAFWAFFSSEGALALVLWIPLWMYVSGVKATQPRIRGALIGIALLAVGFLVLRATLSPGGLVAASPRGANALSWFQNASVQLAFPFVAAGLTLWPGRLNFLHYAHPPQSALDPAAVWVAAGLLAAVALIVALRRRKILVSGLAWYLGSLFPAAVVPLNVAWAEHRAYLALAGLCLVAGKVIEAVVNAYDERGWKWGALAVRSLLVLVLLCFVAQSYHRSGQWRREESIYSDAAEHSPGYDVVWNFLAEEARKDGDRAAALGYLRRAVGLNPRYADAHNSMAGILIDKKDFGLALKAAERAVELDPANPTYWNNLGVSLWGLGKLKEAEKVFIRALDRAPPYEPNRRMFERNLKRLRSEMAAPGAGDGAGRRRR